MTILVIPGLTLAELTDPDRERIRRVAPDGMRIVVSSPSEATAHASDARIVLGHVSREFLHTAPALEWVHAIASGVDAQLFPEFVASRVILTSEKGLVGEHLADHGFGLLLALTRQLAAARDLGVAAWKERPRLRAAEIELTGARMAIIGFGGTGRAMARRALAFGMTVRAVDRDPVAPGPSVEQIEPSDKLFDVLADADVVNLCCPLTRETRGMMDARAFAAMKPGAWLINVTRGEVMDEAALVKALESGRLRGAGLDVAPREPLPADSRLWHLPNVVMTPHTAGASQFRARRNLDRFIANLARYGHAPLDGMIDKQLGY
jgi:phosphoglycerate dehydrogenase-like enzyme